MRVDMSHLFARRHFMPLFLTQFLGAANDNLFKSALIMLITFDLAEKTHLDGPILVTLAAGLFIAPFFLFSATAGVLADLYDKSKLAQLIKAMEIVIMGSAAFAFLWGDVYALLTVLFFMGTQSAFFGPVKYAILPQHLRQEELISANALVGGGTFLAILVGTITGGLLILRDDGLVLVSGLMIGLAVLGFVASLFIPSAPAPIQAQGEKASVHWNMVRETVSLLRHAGLRLNVFVPILGISWFWLVGATFLSQFPAFAKMNLGGDENLVTLFLAVFSIGIGCGSMLCSKLLKGEITAKFVPLASFTMSAFMVDLYFASTGGKIISGGRLDAFLIDPSGVRIVFDLLMIAVSGGVFIVPLYALLQSRGDAAHRARDIAANNIMNALFMVVSAVAVMLVLASGFTISEIFLGVGILNIGVGVYFHKANI